MGPICRNDSMTAGRSPSEKLKWSEQNQNDIKKAQKYLSNASTITMPRKSDKLWIVLDATTKSPAIGATLYIERAPGAFKCI